MATYSIGSFARPLLIWYSYAIAAVALCVALMGFSWLLIATVFAGPFIINQVSDDPILYVLAWCHLPVAVALAVFNSYAGNGRRIRVATHLLAFVWYMFGIGAVFAGV